MSLHWFDPNSYADDDLLGRGFARKATAELSHLSALRLNLQQGQSEPHDQSILEHLARVTSRRSYRDLIARQPRAIWLYAMPYAALRMAGREDTELRYLVQQVVTSGPFTMAEQLGTRQLEVVYVLESAEIDHHFPTRDALFARTLSGGPPNCVGMREAEVYSLTHAFLFASGFGTRELATSRIPCWDTMPGTLEALQELQHHAGQMDLLAQLLLCGSALGLAQSEMAERSWNHLGGLQATDGSFRSPPHLTPDGRSDLRYGSSYVAWRTSYHTTLCTVMAASAALRASSASGYPRADIRIDAVEGDQLLHGQAVEDALTRANMWLRRHPSPLGIAEERAGPFGGSVPDLVEAWKSYRLGDAADIARGLLAQRKAARIAHDVVALLLSQQQMNGSLGYFITDEESDALHVLRWKHTSAFATLLQDLLLTASPSGRRLRARAK